jgi:hypothetical protein
MNSAARIRGLLLEPIGSIFFIVVYGEKAPGKGAQAEPCAQEYGSVIFRSIRFPDFVWFELV